MSQEWLVSPAWVADRLDDPTVQLVDVRDRWAYEGIGHLPEARHIPFERYRDASDDAPGMLPTPDAFGSLLGDRGIKPTETIVVYDDTHGVFAARFVVTALAYGHQDVKLLNGDFSTWKQEHRITDVEPTVEATTYQIDDLAADAPVVDRETVEAAIDSDNTPIDSDDTLIDSNTTLIDTRDTDEYEAGHLPGAVQLDWMELVDRETRGVKSAGEIEMLLAERGITTDRDHSIILYCNTARRLSHTFVVLRSLGFEDVAIYDGSLREWTGKTVEIADRE